MLLGIDVGTTGVKAAVFTLQGEPISFGFRDYGVICAYPGHAEQDAEAVWRIVKEAVGQAAAELGPQIEAIGVSVQGDAIIPVSKNRQAIANAHLGMDYRATAQVEQCIASFSERELFNRTGMRPHPMNSAIKIMWMLQNMPELTAQLYKFTTYSDYLLAKLGSDDFVVDHTMASRSMCFDIRKKEWDSQILSAMGIDSRLLSRPVPSGTVVGRIASPLASELRVNPKALLVAGGHDQTCAALGAGIIRPGSALDSHGTAEVISACLSDIPDTDALFKGYYPCYLSASGGYFTFALNHTAGILLQWYRDNLAFAEILAAKKSGRNAYEEIAANIQPRPSPLLVLPHFGGAGTPICDLSSHGAILGLSMSSTRHDIASAILDSLAFEMRLNLETMSAAGISINELRAVGGGVKNPADAQRKADVFGIPISTLKVREAACLGAALLAGLGFGHYRDTDDAAAHVATDCVYYPDVARSATYDGKYAVYSQLYNILKPINHMVSRQNSGDAHE